VAEEARLPQAPKNWSCGELIGAGAFGRVYLGLNSDNGELVAVKQVENSITSWRLPITSRSGMDMAKEPRCMKAKCGLPGMFT